MKHTKSKNSYISPLTGATVEIPEKRENETYTETMYRESLVATKKAIESGVASFCGGKELIKKHSLSMDF